MPAYAYGRVSTDRQENGREGQLQKLLDAASRDGIAFADEPYFDEDVSGSVPFNQRPKGKTLWDKLAPGDCVYITKVDRGFRSMSDAAFTLEKWKSIGVRVRIVDLGIDVSSPAGEMFFHLLAAFATFERQIISARTKEALAYRTRQRGVHANARPIGWRKLGSKQEGWRLEPDEREREVAEKARELRQSGLGWRRLVVAMWRGKLHKKNGNHYDQRDIKKLIAAAEAGYPKTPQSALRAAARASTQPSC